MCGIAGAYSYREGGAPASADEVLRMREYMAARGPDGSGLWTSAAGHMVLGHRRLSIIDLSGGASQPMVADGLAITFNGEIYNYRELRRDLQARGHRFTSESDTEVLLHLYREYGEAMFAHLRGMFAFALWDERKRALLLARDAFGIKPLYYSPGSDGVLRFASQVKALLASGCVDTTPDPAGQVGFLLWGSVPSPWTMYRDVQALPAGHFMCVDEHGVHAPRAHCNVRDIFAQAAAEPARCSRDEALDAISAALRDSIAAHYVADVPVSLFLSAGIDSALIAALSAEVGKRPEAATIVFDQFAGTTKDETPVAASIAAQYGLPHRRIAIGRHDFESQAKVLMRAMDQPSIDGINSWFISRAASQAGIKVALSGLGGDELFASYPSFTAIPRIRSIAAPFDSIPRAARALRRVLAFPAALVGMPKHAGLPEYGGSLEGGYLLKRALFMPWEHESLPDARSFSEGWDKLRTMQHLRETVEGIGSTRMAVSALEMSWYMRHQLLVDTDWASMAHSLEVRVPFLDLPLLRAAAPFLAAHPDIRKNEVAAHAARSLPQSLLAKPKAGFTVPVRKWMLGRSRRPLRPGLRDWALLVMRESLAPHAGGRGAAPKISAALWSPEMATAGGIQSYMWRLWEVLTQRERFRRPAAGMSLMDTPTRLAAHVHPSVERPVGSAADKLAFFTRAMVGAPRDSVAIVGHLHHAPIALLARVLRRIGAYVVVLHGLEAWQRLPLFQRLALRHANRVIATTRYTARTCASVNGLPEGNFQVIPLCADPSPAPAATDFTLDGGFPILFVGRLAVGERYKGLEPLMEATAQLRAKGLEAVLHVVGDGNDKARLEEIARSSGHDGFVRFHGRLDDSRLQAAYMTARVFAMPSAKEGFGIVFLEAMRYGVPCVGGAHGGTPEVFHDGVEGFTVAYGDVDALAACLEALARDESHRQAMGAAGRQRFERDYSFGAFASRWEQMLEEVQSGRIGLS